jgi:spore coat protein U-like protein
MRKPIQKMLQSLTALIMLLMTGGVMAAGTNTLTVSAVVLSKSNCKFNSATSTLNFGSLNPASSVDVTATASIVFVCRGSAPIATFFMSDDDGLYETGFDANRMRHATVLTEHLPYSLTLSPITASVPKNVNQTLTLTGTVRAVDYQIAYAGGYADTVILTISP